MAHGMPGGGPGGPGGPGGRYLTDEEKANKPQITSALLKRVFSYIAPYWKQMAVVMLCLTVSTALSIYPSILTGRIIDEGLIGENLPLLVKLIILSFAVMLISSLIGVLQNYLNTWIAQHITYDMRNQMYRHLQQMPQSFFTENSQGEIITRMTSDIDSVQSVIANTFTNILSNAMTLIIAVIAMFRKNAIMAVLGMIIVPLFTIPTRYAGQNRWKLAGEAQECNDRINGILNETLSVSGQMLVKLFTREEAEYAKYEQANGEMMRLNIRERMAGRWFLMILQTLTSIGPLLLYLVGGVLMLRYHAGITVGDITVMVTLLSRMYGPVNSLLNFQVEWIRSMASFTRLFEYYDMKPEVENPARPVKMSFSKGTVEFDHVRFSYSPEREILKDVSFSLKSGHSIAIVGPSGSGKSTIINLIPRLYDVTAGCVKFDGVDVRRHDLTWLRSQIGIVSQETYLFNSTIRENLRYAREDASEAEMVAACKKANIYDFIESQPDGLDTVVGNRGLKLSGGEKQRIAIARALLKDPALLIFDEATSSLDSISESKIQEAIDPLIESRTSILIAHRLSTILAADEILVVKDGQIVERGQHEELVRLGGVYTELYETQFGKSEELLAGGRH